MSDIYDKCTISIKVHGRSDDVLIISDQGKQPTCALSRWDTAIEYGTATAREVANELTRSWRMIGIHKEKEAIRFYDPTIWGHLDYPGFHFSVLAMDWRNGVELEDLGRQRWLVYANKPLGTLAKDAQFMDDVIISKLMDDYGMNIINYQWQDHSPTGQKYTSEIVFASPHSRRIMVESKLHRDV